MKGHLGLSSNLILLGQNEKPKSLVQMIIISIRFLANRSQSFRARKGKKDCMSADYFVIGLSTGDQRI